MGYKKMNKSRKKNAILNILIGYLAQIGVLILSFVGRKIFLEFLSIEYLGINGLYSNILTVLSLAELGLDSAVVYSLYKPVATGDVDLTYSLIKYFKKIYYGVAVGIFVLGLMLVPFLRIIIKSDLATSDLIFYYILFLINTVSSYLVAHKVALLSASQEQRIQKITTLISSLILQIVHIVVLIIWRNYYIYIITTVFNTLLYNYILSIICDKIHPELKGNHRIVKIDKTPIITRIKHTFMYKLGVVAINNTDNILISSLVSTAAVGLYSNYYTVVSAFQGFVSVITTSMISGVGNLAAGGNKKRQYEIFQILLLLYHFIAALGGIGFGLLFNNLIKLWLGNKYIFSVKTVAIISFNYYVTCAINPVWMYREANGLFKEVKYLMLIRAALNIFFSLAFGMAWGTFGILFATLVSLILTSFWYEPQILFRKVFEKSSVYYWIKQAKYFLLTVISLTVCSYVVSFLGDSFLSLMAKTIIVGVITIIIFAIGSFKTLEIQELLRVIRKQKK